MTVCFWLVKAQRPLAIAWAAETFQQSGFFAPGHRPGAATDAYLAGIIARITAVGALGMAVLAAGVPHLLWRLTHEDVTATVLSVFRRGESRRHRAGQCPGVPAVEVYPGLIAFAKRT